MAEHFPSLRAKRGRRFFFQCALSLHDRDKLSRHEGEGDEQRSEHEAREREHDLHVMRR